MHTFLSKKLIIRFIVLLECFVVFSNRATAQLSLVKDINVEADSSYSAYPEVITPLNGGVIYAGSDSELGRELWWSNGVGNSTVLVKDINPKGDSNPGNPFGYIDGLPSYHNQYLITIDNKVLFAATDGEHGYELWISDGTTLGTHMVKDIFPGSMSSNPSSIVKAGQQVFFEANDGGSGRELWKTDGTASGTLLVKDIFPGEDQALFGPLKPIGNKVFFSAEDGATGREPWMSDGTPEGTVLIKDITPGEIGSYPDHFIGTDQEFYFSTWAKVWKSNGTDAGTQFFLEGRYTPESYLNGILYLMGGDPGTSPTLYQSNGTLAGTSIVMSLPFYSFVEYSSVRSLVVDNELFFLYSYEDRSMVSNDPFFTSTLQVNKIDKFNSISGLFEDFLIDQGAVFSFPPFGNAFLPGILLFTKFGNNYYSILGRGSNQAILLKEPGSSSQTFTYLGNGYGSDFLTVSSDRLFYRGLTNSFPDYNDSELWTSKNSLQSTRIVKNTFKNSSSDPHYFKSFKDQLFFLAKDSAINLLHLWKTDGTQAGTVNLGPELNIYDRKLVEFKGNLYFTRQIVAGGLELWKTDGTTDGTTLIKVIDVNSIIATENTLFLYCYDNEHGYEFWTSDGTTEGTVLLKDIIPGPTSTNIRTFTVYKNKLLFTADDGTHGYELWQSDGTTEGTTLLKDLVPGPEGSYPGDYHFLEHKGILYFNATDAEHGNELWKTDGTEQGTELFLEVVPGPTWSHPDLIGSVNDRMLFRTYTEDIGGNGLIQYRSTDGTNTEVFFNDYLGDIMVKDNIAYFSYDNDLFTTNGTVDGTVKIRDQNPINYKSTYNVQEIIEGEACLNQYDDTHGNEFWISNGTEAGTRFLADVFLGENSSFPSEMLKIKNTIFFAAQNGTVGRELWKYVFSPTLEVSQNKEVLTNNSLIEFPDTETNTISDTIRITLKNTGEYALNFQANPLTIEGIDPSQFGIKTSELSSIPIGDSSLVKVWYKPQQGGSHEATVTIRTDDPEHSIFNIQLTGEAHEITAIEQSLDVVINVYPNPSTGSFGVTSDKALRGLSLKDSSGKTIDARITKTNSNEATISIENSSGIYFLRIDLADAVVFKKIVMLK